MFYKSLIKPLLFRFDPENIHDLFITLGGILGSNPLSRALTGVAYDFQEHHHSVTMPISKTVDGITYRTPVLLAAGFDYNGRLVRILPRVGFGGEEIGSVTARPCAGNPRPRLMRLPRSGSIIVNKGLKNDGVDEIIRRLKKLRKPSASQSGRDFAPKSPDFVIGVSIARTNDSASVPIEAGIEDYCYSFRRLNQENVGDYYTLNISCPNAFGAEAFTDPMLLDRLLASIKKIPCSKPVYVKMPINLPWPQFDSLLKIILRYGLHGVVISNLNKNYNSLEVRAEAPKEYAGGLSGKPCRALSNELIKRTRQAYGEHLTIIGVGGVDSPETAMEKFEAGADLIQLITGMIYEGPGLIGKIAGSLVH